MGKWMDNVKSLDAQVTLPAKPTEAPSAGFTGSAGSPTEESFGSGEHMEERLLSWFARSGQLLRVYSKLLDEIIVLVADNATESRDEAVLYRVTELRSIVGWSADRIRSTHTVRKVFDGELLEQPTDGEEKPSPLLLNGPAAVFHTDILTAQDDGELVVICERLDVAYKAGDLKDRCLDYLTSAVTDRANQLEAADDVEP
jgi:hypothetical protein